MKHLIIALICTVLYGNALGQSLTVEYIGEWINLCDPKLDLSKKEKLYIIEGVPYYGTKLKQKLLEFDVNDKHFYLDYLDSDSVETAFLKPNLIIVLILNLNKVNLKARKKSLESVQNKFKDQYDFRSHHIMTNSEDPVLYINEDKINHAIASKKVNELRAKEIKLIVFVNHAPITYYGQNARNGLVRIWMK